MTLPKTMRKDARKRFYELLKCQGSDCAECGDPMVILPEGQHTSNMYQATIDHKVPISEGGSNAIENLELVHRQCNLIRNSRRQVPIQRSLVCKHCGVPRDVPKRKYCRECRRGFAFMWAGVGCS